EFRPPRSFVGQVGKPVLRTLALKSMSPRRVVGLADEFPPARCPDGDPAAQPAGRLAQVGLFGHPARRRAGRGPPRPPPDPQRPRRVPGGRPPPPRPPPGPAPAE